MFFFFELLRLIRTDRYLFEIKCAENKFFFSFFFFSFEIIFFGTLYLGMSFIFPMMISLSHSKFHLKIIRLTFNDFEIISENVWKRNNGSCA